MPRRSYKNLVLGVSRSGRLVVEGFTYHTQKGGKRVFCAVCRCDCGVKDVPVSTHLFMAESTKSCGCLTAEAVTALHTVHGMTGTRAHVVWLGLFKRCENPEDRKYHRYGGRGIKIHESFREFAGFWAYVKTLLPDASEDIPDALTLDRIDNDADYCPGNLRLADWHTQSRNNSRNVNITIDGVTRCRKDWCAVYGITESAVRGRMRRGWPAVAAIVTPVGQPLVA